MFRPRYLGRVASLVGSGVCASFVAAAADSDSIPRLREHRTGHTFPLLRGDSALLGANTRCMLGWCRLAIARAYAFGLFADEVALEAGVGAGGTRPRVAAVLDSAESGAGSVSLILVIARSIEGDHLAHGFRNSVINRYKRLVADRGFVVENAATAAMTPSPAALASGRAAAARNSGASSSAHVTPPNLGASSGGPLSELGALCAGFSGRFFEVGDEAVLEWRNGVVRLSICGENIAKAELHDPLLARALFEVYAGENGVSARALKTFEANLGELAVMRAQVAEKRQGQRLTQTLVDVAVREHATRTK